MIDFLKYDMLDRDEEIVAVTTIKSLEYEYLFSLALHTKEDSNKIVHNRKTLLSRLDLEDYSVVLANQTHSCNIAVINSDKSRGWFEIDSAIKDSDALISDRKGVLLGVLTADCVPILLFDEKKSVIGAVHAGWRGSGCEIVKKSVEKMMECYGSNPSDIKAIIAPSIGSCCYEVDWNVAQHFSSIDGAYVKKGDKYMLDLVYINKHSLLSIGVKDDNIYLSGICTSCSSDKFFSYRKEQGCSGRFLTLIGMKK